tara:strand:- start:3337 stop:3819 length:483 start_codon:yes stop_codon:yes gene_type:complete
MTITLCANPYSYNVPFFYFDSREDYDEKYQKNFDKYHCEEYEFQFIDGDEVFTILWNCIGSDNVFRLLEIYEEGTIDNERDARALEVCMTLLGMDLDDALLSYEDIYLFEGSKEDYAYDCFPWYDVPEYLHSYVDLDQYLTDLECGGDITDLGNGYIYIR